MIAEAAVPAASVPDAAQEVRDSLDRVRMSQRGYARTRHRASPALVTQARTDWGLAVLEWIEASVALAEAEDARDPAWAASAARRTTAPAGPVRGRIESSWERYQQVRKNGGPEQVARARGQWREALVDWFQGLAQQRAAEDGQRAAARRAERDQAAAASGAGMASSGETPGAAAQAGAVPDGATRGGGGADDGTPDGAAPDGAAPDGAAESGPGRDVAPPAWSPAGRPRSAPRPGQPRYQPLAAGWTPAKRPSGS
jgi:hypothetical protein